MPYDYHFAALTNLLGKSNTSTEVIIFLSRIQTDNSLSLDEKFSLLSQASILTLAHERKALLEKYLALTTEILTHPDSTFSSQQIYTLLSTRTTDGWTLGNFIARYYPILLEQYLPLLLQLKAKGFNTHHIHALVKIESIVMYKKSHYSTAAGTYTTNHIESHAFINYLLDVLSLYRKYKNNIDTPKLTKYLFELLDDDFLSPEEYKNKHLLAQKDNICAYIINLPENDAETKQAKLNYLQHALNPQHALGKYFLEQRGLFTVDYNSGTLAQLKEAFLKLTEFKNHRYLYNFLFTDNQDLTMLYGVSYTVLLDQKHDMCSYLFNDDNWSEEKSVERIAAIKAALNPDTPLGKLIWCKRPTGVPTKTNGTRATLIKKLQALEPLADLSFIPEAIEEIVHDAVENQDSIQPEIIQMLHSNWQAISHNNQAIDDFITKFIASEDNISQLITALSQLNDNGYTVWHEIALISPDLEKTNTLHLKLFVAILAKNPQYAYPIFEALNMRTPTGWTIGNIITDKQPASLINLYLEVLLALKKTKLHPYFLCILQLNQTTLQTESSRLATPTTFVTQLAQRKGNNISGIIVRFLFNDFLLFKSKDVDYTLLDKKELIKDFLMHFSDNQELLLNALKKIFTPNTVLNIFFLTQRGAISPTYHSGTLKPLTEKFISIMHFDDPRVLYPMLILENFPYAHEILAEQKKILFIYILSISDKEERKIAMENALNTEHLLGKVFWLQRGPTKPSKDAGTLKELQNAYDNIELTYESSEISKNLLAQIQAPAPALKLPMPISIHAIPSAVFLPPSPFAPFIIHRKNIRNYIFSLSDIREKLKLLSDSLNPETQLGKFFQEGISFPNPYKSPRLVLLHKAFNYFSSLPEAQAHQDIHLCGPYFVSAKVEDEKEDDKNIQLKYMHSSGNSK